MLPAPRSSNVNLSKPPSEICIRKIMKAFTQHHVLIFRQQNLSKIEQESFTRNFGEIEGHVGRLPNGQRLPNVHTVTNIDNLTGKPTAAPHTDGNYYWHTDKSYHAVPSLMTLLHAVDIHQKVVIHFFAICIWLMTPFHLKNKKRLLI